MNRKNLGFLKSYHVFGFLLAFLSSPTLARVNTTRICNAASTGFFVRGNDLNGNSMGSLVDEATCASNCQAESNCLGYSYSATQKRCWLKGKGLGEISGTFDKTWKSAFCKSTQTISCNASSDWVLITKIDGGCLKKDRYCKVVFTCESSLICEVHKNAAGALDDKMPVPIQIKDKKETSLIDDTVTIELFSVWKNNFADKAKEACVNFLNTSDKLKNYH